MADASEFIDSFLKHALTVDERKRYNREYYLRTRELKGRKDKQVLSPEQEKRLTRERQQAEKAKVAAQITKDFKKLEKPIKRAIKLQEKIDRLPPGPKKTSLESRMKPLSQRLSKAGDSFKARSSRAGVDATVTNRMSDQVLKWYRG